MATYRDLIVQMFYSKKGYKNISQALDVHGEDSNQQEEEIWRTVK